MRDEKIEEELKYLGWNTNLFDLPRIIHLKAKLKVKEASK